MTNYYHINIPLKFCMWDENTIKVVLDHAFDLIKAGHCVEVICGDDIILSCRIALDKQTLL